MTYSLFLHFKPPVARDRTLRYFAGRKHFKIADVPTHQVMDIEILEAARAAIQLEPDLIRFPRKIVDEGE